MSRIVTRRFPDYGWAWPAGDHDRLLKAILTPDDKEALRAALQWLDTHDIDAATFREHRLLAALAERFGKKLSASPALPRLMGLQRMLWSKSRMAFRDSREALEALSRSGIPFMLIKGASYIAADPALFRSRISYDIDALIRQQDMRDAFDVLFDGGWQASSGAGHLRLRQRAAGFRAMNFYKGEYGDIDLHLSAYHPSQESKSDEDGLWERSLAASFDGIPLRVPAASDRIALAIAHSSFDAHAHSDWLIDMTRTIAEGEVDWSAFLATVNERRILIPAASALAYLGQDIGIAIPKEVLDRMIAQADGLGLAERLLLLECKPKTDLGAFATVGRGIVKQLRLRRAERRFSTAPETVWRTRLARRATASHEIMRDRLALPVQRPGASTIELILQVDAPPARRRIEFELTTEKRHIAVLRYRKLSRSSGLREIKFSGPVELEADEPQLFIQSSAQRAPRQLNSQEEVERYGAVPFAVLSSRIRPES